MALQPLNQFPCTKGIVASNQPLAEPKGAISRGSNLIYTARGALDVCDGSAELFEWNGAVQNNRGPITANFLFEPIGVNNYYLSIQKLQSGAGLLGPPYNLQTTTSSGGSLGAHTYYYKVTALDGAGGETTPSAENSVVTSAGGKNTLTWNVVPNAQAYNVYRSTSPGAEVLLLTGSTATLPVPQPTAGTITVTFVDDGSPQLATASYVIAASTASPVGAYRVFSGSVYILYFNTTSLPTSVLPGDTFTVAGCTPSLFNGNFLCQSVTGTTIVAVVSPGFSGPPVTGGGGTLSVSTTVPTSDTTQQTALYQMPVLPGAVAPIPLTYTDANIVALWPADFPLVTPSLGPTIPVVHTPIGGGGGGGSGGGGGTGAGGSSGTSNTPSGGVQGNVSYLPQFKQFTNRAIIALGNGYPVQIYSDPTTAVNRAAISNPSSLVADNAGVITVTTFSAHNLTVGSNVIIYGASNPAFNGTFIVIQVVSATVFKVRNLAPPFFATASGGTVVSTTQPVQSTFVPSYPVWAATTVLQTNDVIQPTAGHMPATPIYLTVTQGGTTGGTEPTWPTTGSAAVGQTVSDGTVIYTVAGLLNSAAPPPPGGAHIEVYSGALWVFNTSPSDTSNGLDGPCSLRMSSINNPNSWNPINQAFLDKDDGQEGMGLAKFTITAIGIPPEGSLIAFKNYLPYQIIGIFGAANFAIQAVSTDMGALAPRTIQFVPGYGIVRYTHLGFAIFNGVKDEVISEQIRPYLFPNNDFTYSDITVVDANNVSISWGSQTATPPMFVAAMPIGISGGKLTRMFCYDLIFKAWAIVDLPFAISTIAQFRTVSANPVTVMGGFNDGAIQRWQSGDVPWDTGATGARVPSNVVWSFRSQTVASQNTDERIFVRRLVVTGVSSGLIIGGIGTITVQWRQNGVNGSSWTYSLRTNGDFDLDNTVQFTSKRFDVIVSGESDAQIDGLTWEVESRPAGVVVAI